jgi:hypothetical protein
MPEHENHSTRDYAQFTVNPYPLLLIKSMPDPDGSASREYRTDLNPADPDRYQFPSIEKVRKLNFFQKILIYRITDTIQNTNTL